MRALPRIREADTIRPPSPPSPLRGCINRSPKATLRASMRSQMSARGMIAAMPMKCVEPLDSLSMPGPHAHGIVSHRHKKWPLRATQVSGQHTEQHQPLFG
jgi:hypothetical protein